MADPAEGGGSEQDDISFLRTVSDLMYYVYHFVVTRVSIYSPAYRVSIFWVQYNA